ncbi:MAG: hypothetical protein QXG39_08510, partial [Candidatus Aenigmatarchaeota archaeon]
LYNLLKCLDGIHTSSENNRLRSRYSLLFRRLHSKFRLSDKNMGRIINRRLIENIRRLQEYDNKNIDRLNSPYISKNYSRKPTASSSRYSYYFSARYISKFIFWQT